MDKKKVETIQKTAEKLTSDNKKSVNSARKALAKLAHSHPDEFVAAGLRLEDFPRFRNEVVKYGCLSDPISVGVPNNSPDDEMRAAHEYFNMLCDAVKPLVIRYREITEGPIQRRVKEQNRKISEHYDEIRTINQTANFERIKKINPDAVEQAQPLIDQIKEKIQALKVERDALSKEAMAEASDLREQNTDRLKEIDNLINATIKNVRNRRPGFAGKKKGGGLWFGNYLRVEEEFKQSRKAAQMAPYYSDIEMRFRYRNRDGSRPGNICSLQTWNGEGSLTTILSQNDVPKSVGTILNGSNPRFRIRPITPKDLERFGLPNWKRLDDIFIASIRNGKNGWYEVPFVMHRSLAPDDLDDEVREVNYVRRKMGLKKEGNLYVTMKRLIFKNKCANGNTAHITPTWEVLPSGNIKCCEWNINGNTGYEEIPSNIQNGMEQSVRIMGYIKAHVDGARQMLIELGGTDDPSDALPKGLPAGTRSAMRHSYRAWCQILCPDTATEDEKKVFQATLREMRAFTRNRHGKFKGQNSEEDSGSYGSSYGMTIALLAEKAQSKLRMNTKDAMAFSVLLAFDERYSHLYPWAVNLNAKKLRQRTDIYRNIAVKIGKQVSTIIVPKVDYRTRRMTDLQKTVSPSELVKWLKNYADREGLQFIEEKVSRKDASAPVVKETPGSARTRKNKGLGSSEESVATKKKRGSGDLSQKVA